MTKSGKGIGHGSVGKACIKTGIKNKFDQTNTSQMIIFYYFSLPIKSIFINGQNVFSLLFICRFTINFWYDYLINCGVGYC